VWTWMSHFCSLLFMACDYVALLVVINSYVLDVLSAIHFMILLLCYPLIKCNSDYQVHVMGHVPCVS
jgi:hypothetical protein